MIRPIYMNVDIQCCFPNEGDFEARPVDHPGRIAGLFEQGNTP